MSGLLKLSLAALARELRGGGPRVATLAEECIDAHRRRAALNAYKTFDEDAVSRQAAALDAQARSGAPVGALFGIPVSIKDLIGVRGHPTFAGTGHALPAPWDEDAAFVGWLRRGQALITGKSHTTELAFNGFGLNAHWGAPVNPWGRGRAPGGSSSGAGVSLWDGAALVAVGTDTAGSVRIPASFTGVVGLKTTWARWPIAGVVPLDSSLDTIGLLTRSVADCAYVFAALDPAMADSPRREAWLEGRASPELAGRRLGLIAPALWRALSPSAAEVLDRTRRALERSGARLVEVELPEYAEAFDLHVRSGTIAVEAAAFAQAAIPDWRQSLGPSARARIEAGGAVLAKDYVAALAKRRMLTRAARARMADSGADIFISPASVVAPPDLAAVEAMAPDAFLKLNRETSRAVNPVNTLGLSALTLPVGLDGDGLPVAIQFLAPGGEDERLIDYALAAEAALGPPQERLGSPPGFGS